MKPDLAKSLHQIASPTAESRILEEELEALGVELSAIFPDIEPSFEDMMKQFSGRLPDAVVDERLEAVRALDGVETAWKKPPALPAAEQLPAFKS